ncbi:MAG: glycosyltransferase family 4 protein [Sphaerobacter sp.]|nr:glycosyltransferase family 4 protein [Sphaerobacter sp.]
MKVGLILPGFSASETDWCIPALLALVRELAARHDVRVFPLRYPHTTRPYRVHGARVVPLGGGDTRGLARLALLRRALAAVALAHRRERFDVLHAFWADEPGFVAVAAGWRLGVPAIVSLAGGELVHLPDIGYGGAASRLNRWLVGIALRGAAHTTAGSRAVIRLAAPHVPRGTVSLVPLGVDTARFAPATPRRQGEETRLLHVGSLVPVKDQAGLLRACALLAGEYPALRLAIAGDGPLRPRLEALVAELGLAGRVTFQGAVAHDHLPALYQAADLFSLSSRYEAQGLVALEAAACGLPIVGTAVGCLPDLGPAARCAPPGNPQALASALRAVLSDPAERERLRRAGLAAVAARYTLAHTVAALEELYRCAGGRPTTSPDGRVARQGGSG